MQSSAATAWARIRARAGASDAQRNAPIAARKHSDTAIGR